MNLHRNHGQICFTTINQWNHEKTQKESLSSLAEKDFLHFYKSESISGYQKLFFHVPEKGIPALDHILLLNKKEIVILTETEEELSIVKDLQKELPDRDMSTAEFLSEWLQIFIKNDLIHIESLEREIADLEEEILKEIPEDFYQKLLKIKQNIARLYRYYNQMMEFTDDLVRQKQTELSVKEQKGFEDYKNRLAHLFEETKFVREYIIEVQELYQTEIDIRQNHIMKILTIIATIFFPLSLISGWYGMNFHMPELQSPYGYPVVTGTGIFIVAFCLIFLKKKHYW